MSKEKSTPAPLETTPGKQQDDNIDDLGRKRGGATQEQPEADPKPDRQDRKSAAPD